MLENEVETPMNVHRWRALEVSTRPLTTYDVTERLGYSTVVIRDICVSLVRP